MAQKIIRLCYRKVVDATAQITWDRYVFEDTYNEFLLQAQLYNQQGKYTLFSELKEHVADAEKINFMVSAVVVGYLKQLNGIIPDVKNALDKACLLFKNYRFEIVESCIKNKAAHKVAISFISEPLIWHDIIDNYLILSVNGSAVDTDGALLTEMIALQSHLSIFSLKTIHV